MARHLDDSYPSSLAERLERERRRRSFAVPGSSDDEDARMEALFLEWQLSDGRPGARWPAEETPGPSSWSARADARGWDIPSVAHTRSADTGTAPDTRRSDAPSSSRSGRHPA